MCPVSPAGLSSPRPVSWTPGPHEADTVALRPPARHQPPPPRHTSASEQHVLAKIFFHFCTAIVLVPMYPMLCIAMLKIKGSTYTRFKKLHMSEVPNAIRFRETFKVHWWIKDETALSFFHFLQALLWNVLLMMRNDWHRMFRIRN